MAEKNDIANTVDGTQFGSSLKDLADGDLSRGYFTQGFDDEYEEGVPAGPIRHPGHIESERYRETHGLNEEYGFVRRPTYRSDVERN